MQISFTEKKNIRKSFGKLKESLSIPNLIEVQKNSYNEFLESKSLSEQLKEYSKGIDKVFKSVFPIEDGNDKSTLEYISYKHYISSLLIHNCSFNFREVITII